MNMLNTISAFFVIAGIFSAVVIAIDLFSRKQSMGIMNSVWILTGLWASILGLWAYFKFGRARKSGKMNDSSMTMPMEGMKMGGKSDSMPGMKRDSMAEMKMDMGAGSMPGMKMGHGAKDDMQMGMKSDSMPEMGQNPVESMEMSERTMPLGKKGDEPVSMGNMAMDMKMPARAKWQSVTLSTLHCGAGCTLADIIGEIFLIYVPIAIAGSAIFGGWAFDYALALVIGVFFQFAAIRSMEKIGVGKAFGRAFKADFLSLTSWQVGMYGWMAIALFVLFRESPLAKDSWTFWFMMQIAMLCGFICAYPVNILLIKAGIKKSM